MINPEDMNVEGMERDMSIASHKAYMERCHMETQEAIKKAKANEFIKALHTIRDFCLSINCEDCPIFSENGHFVCEFKPYLWGTIPSPLECKKKEGEENEAN